MAFKGDLFGTNMVRAYLGGRKLHTARPAKIEFLPGFNPEWSGYRPVYEYGEFFLEGSNHRNAIKHVKPKFQPGDFMYCRETWRETGVSSAPYAYFADEPELHLMGESGERLTLRYRWHPSIHMPRSAARLFFRVTKVEVMRLDDVDEQFAREDGFLPEKYNDKCADSALDKFSRFWETTYGPAARWMWVYWTEPVSKEEAYGTVD